MSKRALILCGIWSSILYAGMTVFVAMRWEGYNSASQTISELSAIGAPTRSLWIPLGALYTVLIMAFGWGVRSSAGQNGALAKTGGLILLFGALGLLWPLAPMHLREDLAAGGGTISDTMHLVLGAVSVLFMILAIAFGAAAFGRGFRIYSFASLLVLAVFGALTFRDAPGISTNSPTPWLGVWERLNIGAYMLWIAALAVVILRSARAHQAPAVRSRAA